MSGLPGRVVSAGGHPGVVAEREVVAGRPPSVMASVMAVLVAATHDFLAGHAVKSWMAATSTAMTPVALAGGQAPDERHHARP